VNKNIIYSVVIGVAIYAVVIYLAFIQRDLTGQQLILMLAAPLAIGVVSGGVKKGLSFGFLIPFIMLILESAVLQPGAFANPNVVLAVVVMMVLPLAAISAGLGAAGGLIGKRVFKKSG